MRQAADVEHRDLEYEQGLNFCAIYFKFLDFLHCELILIYFHLGSGRYEFTPTEDA